VHSDERQRLGRALEVEQQKVWCDPGGAGARALGHRQRFTLQEACLAWAGIATIDQALVQEEIDTEQLVQVLPQWSSLPVDLHLLTASQLMPARVRLFGEILIQELTSATM
jgi:DNA-binding transcriptional LysR family regulator